MTPSAALRLMRIDASVVIFISIFLPVLSRTGDFAKSLETAAPMLFAAFCTWIANDIDDRDRDKINHPERPLASGAIKSDIAGAVFFICLAASLVTTYRFVDPALAFWYYLVIILGLSYGYVVELVPTLKAPYVAAALAIPTLILARMFHDDAALQYVPLTVFCFALGKEACMDLVDRPGDTPSLLHNVSSKVVARAAFIALSIGLVILSHCIRTAIDAWYWSGMATLLIAAGVFWFRMNRRSLAIQMLRAELFLGIYYLF